MLLFGSRTLQLIDIANEKSEFALASLSQRPIVWQLRLFSTMMTDGIGTAIGAAMDGFASGS
jgi:hypothetical protein